MRGTTAVWRRLQKLKAPANCFQLYGLTPHGGAYERFSVACSRENFRGLRLFGGGELGCEMGKLL